MRKPVVYSVTMTTEKGVFLIDEIGGWNNLGEDDDVCREEGLRVVGEIRKIADAMEQAVIDTYGRGDS